MRAISEGQEVEEVQEEMNQIQESRMRRAIKEVTPEKTLIKARTDIPADTPDGVERTCSRGLKGLLHHAISPPFVSSLAAAVVAEQHRVITPINLFCISTSRSDPFRSSLMFASHFGEQSHERGTPGSAPDLQHSGRQPAGAQGSCTSAE